VPVNIFKKDSRDKIAPRDGIVLNT